jgi:hypothetical protein
MQWFPKCTQQSPLRINFNKIPPLFLISYLCMLVTNNIISLFLRLWVFCLNLYSRSSIPSLVKGCSTPVERHRHQLRDTDTIWEANTSKHTDTSWETLQPVKSTDTSWKTLTPVAIYWHQLRDTNTSWQTLTPVKRHWHQLRDSWHQSTDIDTSWQTLTPV